MNDLEKLIWNHDRTGSATSFLLSKGELQEFINAAIAVGQEVRQCEQCDEHEAKICLLCA